MYYLKHKNKVVAVIELTNNATHINIKEVIRPEMLPLCAQANQNNINYCLKGHGCIYLDKNKVEKKK